MHFMNRVNLGHIIHVVSISVIFESLFMLSCIPVAWMYHEAVVWPLFESFLVTFGISAASILLTRRFNTEHSVKDSYVSVVFTWLFISLFGTLPFMFTGAIPAFHDAFFETVSGFTTTGSSILVDIEALPKSVLLWRAETHWLGGMGIIVLVIALLPYMKIGGQQMIMAEGGFFSSEKIKARTIDVAKRMWFIYLILTVAEIIVLCIAKMPLFDAVCHSFATIATGGFSTKNSSIIDYSPAIQYIIIVFMILSGMNFTLHYLLFHGKFKKVFSNEEMKTFLSIIIIASLVVTVVLRKHTHLAWEKTFRDSLFQVASLITATGFVSSNYEIWPEATKMILLLVMLTGACAGSTGGGIKVARYVLVYKNLRQHIRKMIRPNSVQVARYNGQPFSPDITAGITTFIFIYYMTIVVGTLFMSLTGLDTVTASSSVITTLGGIGPGFNNVGPIDNFYALSAVGKYYLSFNMILGRLEILSVLIFLVPSFYRR